MMVDDPLSFGGRTVRNIDRFDRGLDGQSANLPVTAIVLPLLLPPHHASGHFFLDGHHCPVAVGQVMRGPVVGHAAGMIDNSKLKSGRLSRSQPLSFT